MTRTSILTVLIAVAATLVMSPVFAQLEEIIVTASKREQTLQEVPIAVSVITGKELERAQINDVLDLQASIPSLRVVQLQNSGQVNFLIRGFGNGANNPGIEPSVGVFIDGVYRSRSGSALGDMPNVERIEVLRGPQSTLFGKNASAGVISVITAEPNMDEMGGSAAFTYGNYNQVIAKGFIDGPITDTLGFSLAATVNERDGYFDNLELGNDINERGRWGVRGQLLWTPTDNLKFRLLADKDSLDERCCGVGNIVDGPTGFAVRLLGGQLVGNDEFARKQYYDLDPVNDIENSGISLQIDWDMDNDMQLVSITSFRNHDRFEDSDVDYTSLRMLSVNNTSDIETFTQEIRLSQSLNSVDWMIAGSYFDESVKYDASLNYLDDLRNYVNVLTQGQLLGLEAALGPLGVPQGAFFTPGTNITDIAGQDDTSTSIFGQVDWHIRDDVTITLGGNYTSVDKDAFLDQTNGDFFAKLDMVQIGFGSIFGALLGQGFDPATAAALAQGASTVACDGSSPLCNPLLAFQPLQLQPQMVDFPNAVENGKSSDSKFTWTARVAWDVKDNMNLYASAATGFKATSWNLSRDSRPFPGDIAALEAAGLSKVNLVSGTRFAGPEETTVYEIGFKGHWDKGYVNMAIFHQEIDGFQSNLFTGTGFVLGNAGTQSTDGFEIDAVWYPVDQWKLGFSGTFLDPIYDSFIGGTGPDGPEDLTGTVPAGIHETSIVLSAEYSFSMGSRPGFIRADYLYESDAQITEGVPAEIGSREVNMVNASAGITFNDRWDVMVWGRNLTNDDYLISAFPSVFQAGSFSGYPNQPRTYGVTVTARF